MNVHTEHVQASPPTEQQYLATIRLNNGKKDFYECTGESVFDARQKAGWAYVREGHVIDVTPLD
ncbi:hypothetical protein [Paraburkholderia youngii]|uniref:hypothetical protein n=1 Tax=Paraburkholderia youngii TaxID=2782701 RepID=UPI003D1F03E4